MQVFILLVPREWDRAMVQSDYNNLFLNFPKWHMFQHHGPSDTCNESPGTEHHGPVAIAHRRSSDLGGGRPEGKLKF